MFFGFEELKLHLCETWVRCVLHRDYLDIQLQYSSVFLLHLQAVRQLC